VRAQAASFEPGLALKPQVVMLALGFVPEAALAREAVRAQLLEPVGFARPLLELPECRLQSA
jgi:hypothetical protein